MIGLLSLLGGCHNALVNEIKAMRIAAVTPAAPVFITLDSPNNIAVFENGSVAPARFTSLKLTWEAVSSATSYYIFRELSSSGNFTSKLSEYTPSSNAGTLEWIDTTAVPGTEYFYKVQAVSLNGRSKLNNVLAVSKLVPGIPVSTLSLASGVIIKGNSSSVIKTFSPSDASVQSATWTSSQPSVATVDATGMVTAHSKGTTIIEATCSDNTGILGNLVLTVVPDLITTIAGTESTSPNLVDGPGLSINLNYPTSVALDSVGDIYFIDALNYRIRKIDHDTGDSVTVAGTGGYQSTVTENILARNETLYGPNGLSITTNNEIYVSIYEQHRIRKITSGYITTVAGTNSPYLGTMGGLAISTGISSPGAVVVDADRNMYIEVSGGIYKVTASTGLITPFAGTSPSISPADEGNALDTLFSVTQIAASSNGDIYIADNVHHIIMKIVQSTGKIQIVAGTYSVSGFSGDGGQARMAKLNKPSGITFDSVGNLYISDTSNHKIRVVSPSGIISTIAGAGTGSFTGDDGKAISANINQPWGLAVNSSGTIYFADYGNHRIRKLY